LRYAKKKKVLAEKRWDQEKEENNLQGFRWTDSDEGSRPDPPLIMLKESRRLLMLPMGVDAQINRVQWQLNGKMIVASARFSTLQREDDHVLPWWRLAGEGAAGGESEDEAGEERSLNVVDGCVGQKGWWSK
jgi:hypothetical protein